MAASTRGKVRSYWIICYLFGLCLSWLLWKEFHRWISECGDDEPLCLYKSCFCDETTSLWAILSPVQSISETEYEHSQRPHPIGTACRCPASESALLTTSQILLLQITLSLERKLFIASNSEGLHTGKLIQYGINVGHSIHHIVKNKIWIRSKSC